MVKILLAEDEEVLRMLVLDTLEDEGYDIDEAPDGLEAFRLIEQNEYDLVIVDHMMPGMTGLEVIEKVRKLPGRQHTKVMMLTAKSQQSDRDCANEIGVDYFISKPFSPFELVKIIGGIVK